jgi:phosphohistidine phosphatase SixA
MLLLITLLSACKPTMPAGQANALRVGDVVVYAIRHMEKETTPGVQDPELTDVGAARAETLATFLADVDLAGAYSTPYNRTMQTLEPVAAAKGLEIDTTWDGRTQLAAHILATHDNEIVIASGHSNTVPDLIAGLGATPPTIAEDSYGELWVVTVQDGMATAVLTSFE